MFVKGRCGVWVLGCVSLLVIWVLVVYFVFYTKLHFVIIDLNMKTFPTLIRN